MTEMNFRNNSLNSFPLYNFYEFEANVTDTSLDVAFRREGDYFICIHNILAWQSGLWMILSLTYYFFQVCNKVNQSKACLVVFLFIHSIKNCFYL